MRRTTPEPPTNPPEPTHTHSEHAIDPQPAGFDHDGVGMDEADSVGGEPLCAVREAYVCTREGCDADPRKDHIYALVDVSQRVQQAARYAIDYTDEPTTEDIVEYLATHAVVVDYDEVPILGFTFDDSIDPLSAAVGGASDRNVLGYVYPHFTDESGFGGQCHGRPRRPDPEPEWRDI